MTNVYVPMTPERRSRIWELSQQGQPMSLIAGEIKKPLATVYSNFLYHGEIEPRSRICYLGVFSNERTTAINHID
jgi:hypothetical protein